MKRITGYSGSTPEFTNIYWSDHASVCAKCRDVDVEQSATFVHACAEGSPLLMEELVKRQAPTVRASQAEVREWAKKAGVFKGVS